jgi:type II secretory pathway pseudopilin PulG
VISPTIMHGEPEMKGRLNPPDRPSLSSGSRAVRALDGERGQSLVEVLIAAVVTVIVLTAVGSLLVGSSRDQVKQANFDLSLSSAQDELDTMVSQLSQATNIVSAGGNSVDFDVTLAGTAYQVFYECDIPAANGLEKCVRQQAAVGATLPSLDTASTVIPQISNGTTTDPVFSWSSSSGISPDYVTATVRVPESDGAPSSQSLGGTIALSDGALMRNVYIEN